MKISQLVKKLNKLQERYGDLEVMLMDPNNSGPWSVTLAKREVVGYGGYPDEWNMPEGYEFVMLENM